MTSLTSDSEVRWSDNPGRERDAFPASHSPAAGSPPWYQPDNIARLFPPVISWRYPATFRIAATLDSPVKLAALERALAQTWKHFPHFCVQMRRGIFWHYLEACPPEGVHADDAPPCTRVPRFNEGSPLLRVYARGPRIAVEASHAVTDGSGAAEFLRTLLVAYVADLANEAAVARAADAPRGATSMKASATAAPERFPGGHAPDADQLFREASELGIGLPGTPPDPDELAYSSREHYVHRLPHPPDFGSAWHIDGERIPRGGYHVATLSYPASELRAVAAKLNGSLTDLILALTIDAFQDAYLSRPRERRHRRPIRILVPVSMRPHTRSRTTRNFFVYVMVSIDQRLGRFSLEEIVRSVHHQLRAELEPRGLRRHISRNVAAERHPLIRIIPIVFKDAILRTVHRLQGEAVNTASFSNLGTLRLPVSVSERIRLLEFVPPASYTTGINVTAVSTAETASIGFGSVLADHRIERRVARQLAGLGLRGRLVCNWRHEQEYAHVL